MIAYCVVTSLHTAQHCGTVPVLRRSSRLQLGSSVASGSLLPDDDDVNVFNKPDNTDEDDDDIAIFTEPGGEFELDMVRVDELVASYEAAEARWEAAAGIPRALGVLEDRGSQLHEWWHDPVDGPVAQARTYYAAVRHERMLRPVVLLLLVGSCLVSAFVAPTSQLARLGVLAIGRAVQLICLFYLFYWIAFAIEAGERTAWRPSLRPRQAESCTLSAALLRASSLVRPPLSLEELRREQGVRSGLVPAVFDESAPAPMGFSSAAEAEDRMLQMWSFGPGDLVDVDGTGMGASLLKLWNPTGVRRQRGEGGNVPMEAANAGDSTYYDRGLGEGAGFFELGRLFLAETAPTPSKGVVPEAMRWTRNESEKALRASVANWTNLQLTNLQAGREGEGVREGRAEILSEIAWMQYGLINYANDKPPGYTMPEIDLVNSTAAMPSELQQTRKQYERASKRGRGGREAQAEQWMATGAAPVDGATGAAFWGRNSTAATDPRVAVLLEEEEEEM
eukprot:jgi/Chrpa1/27722/Chrysochromulina_OHIO_Genome00005052-RA